MKRKMTFCFAMLIISISLNAQNLIRNGDFEIGSDTTTVELLYTLDSLCQADFSDSVVGCDFWSSDYQSDIIRFVYGIPFFNIHCAYDNVIAHSGQAYFGFNSNDGAHTTFVNPLISGQKYELKYYACLDSTSRAYCINAGTPDTTRTWIVFNFNNGGNLFNSPVLPYTGHKGSWAEYDTIFTATANSTLIDIHGNNINSSNPSPFGIYLDDISMQTSNSIPENSINNAQPSISLDPDNDLLLVTFNNHLSNTVRIYNPFGQFIFNSIFKENKAEIPLFIKSSGIYYVTIFSNNSLFSKSFFLNKNK